MAALQAFATMDLSWAHELMAGHEHKYVLNHLPFTLGGFFFQNPHNLVFRFEI